MKKYKIVCSDLDGTLLDSNAEVSKENLAAIDELTKKGCYFVPSTGRCFSELPEEIKNNPSIRYFICSNGTVLFDRKTNKSILTCVSNETSRKILNVLKKYETHISVRQNGYCNVDALYANEEAFDYYNVCQPHRVVVNAYAIFREDFKRFCDEADNVEVISVFFKSYDELLACKEEVENLGGLRIVAVSDYNLEILNEKAGKGNALHHLADMLDVAYTDTISIGDSDNDSSIIEAAGVGLATSNACEVLKKIADEIICSNDEHVVAYVLSHYF